MFVLSGSQRTWFDMTVLTNMFGLYRFSVYAGFGLVRFHCNLFIEWPSNLMYIIKMKQEIHSISYGGNISLLPKKMFVIIRKYFILKRFIQQEIFWNIIINCFVAAFETWIFSTLSIMLIINSNHTTMYPSIHEHLKIVIKIWL